MHKQGFANLALWMATIATTPGCGASPPDMTIDYLHDRDKITLAVGLNMFRGRYTTDFHLLMAVSVISLIPILVIFFLAQRIFI